MIKRTSIAVALVAATAFLTGCTSAEAPAPKPPVSLATVPGNENVKQVTLVPEARQRLGIATALLAESPVAVNGSTAVHKVIPYAAVVYHTDGSTWTFVETADRTFVREPISVEVIQGQTAVLKSGPTVGSKVVVVGASELLGAEYEISGEE
jgi:hypothetical protein